MAGGKSVYLEQALLNHIYHGVPYTAPASVWAALSTAPWNPAATGTGLSEPAGGGYARVPVAAGAAGWSAPSGINPSSVSTLIDAVFPTASGTGWGIIQAAYLVDAATGGNALHGGDVTPVTVNVGSTPQFAAGQLIAQES